LRSRRRTRPASLAMVLILISAPVVPGAGDGGNQRDLNAPPKELISQAAALKIAVFDKRKRLLLLALDRLRLALTGAGVGVRTLTANRQLTTVAETAIATKIHQTLDVHRNFTAKIAFDHIVAVNPFADLENFVIGQLVDATLGRDLESGDDLFRLLGANAVDILKRNNHALIGGDIHTRYTSHQLTPCLAVHDG